MNDFDDLDDLFGPLRSAATDAELAGETSHVDAMARHHRRQKGHTMFTSRRARVATFVAAGVIGFGGVAAAGHGGPLGRASGGGTTHDHDHDDRGHHHDLGGAHDHQRGHHDHVRGTAGARAP